MDDHERARLEADLARYKQGTAWESALAVLRRLVELETDPVRKAIWATEAGNICRDDVHRHADALELYNTALDYYFADCDALNDMFVPGAFGVFELIERMLSADGDWKTLERAYRLMIVRIRSAHRFDDVRAKLFFKLGEVYRDRLGHESSAEAAFAEARAIDSASGGFMASDGPGPSAIVAGPTWHADDPRMNDPAYGGSPDGYVPPERQARSLEELWAALESPHYAIRAAAFEELIEHYDLTAVRRPPGAEGKGSPLDLLEDFLYSDAKAFNQIARDELRSILDTLAAGATPASLHLEWRPDDSPELTEKMHAALFEPEVAFPVEEIRATTGLTRRRWEFSLATCLERADPRGPDALVQLNATWTLPALEEFALGANLAPELRDKIAAAVRYLKVSADAGSLK